jgi:hypothetical protein
MKTPRFIKVCWSTYIWAWELGTIKTFQLRVFAYRMHRRLGPQIAQQGIAFLAHLSQSLVLAAAVLAGNHPDVAAHLVTVGKAVGVAEKHLGRQSRHRSHARMRQQSARL